MSGSNPDPRRLLQHYRPIRDFGFIEAAQKAGASEDEREFDVALNRRKKKPKEEQKR